MNQPKPVLVRLLALALLAAAAALPPRALAADIAVVTTDGAATVERIAAQDLAAALQKIYPRDRFTAAGDLPATGKAILIGNAKNALVRRQLGAAAPTAPESHVVRRATDGAREIGVVAGADARGTAFGVYALLTKLGCSFHLSGDTLPPPRETAFVFDGWQLSDHPVTRERLVFNWHNFLSGCSTWNLPEWQRWTAQSQKMGFNAIMVHAYGNNPMAGFAFEGVDKPVGYLSTTIKGRDWSTMHVDDVRRMFGGEVFDRPAFGADAGLVPDAERVAAAQSLMRAVFADAAQRDIGVYFAVDVDTPSANPQELVLRLPATARFQTSGATSTVSGSTANRIWLPNPDTAEGYALIRAQVDGLVKTYPHITHLVVWFRRDATPWMNLKVTDLPATWQQEFGTEIARTPAAGNYWRAAGLFAVGKIVRAFERALKESGVRGVGLAAGTWGFEFLPAADRFFPAGVPLLGLDYEVLHEKPQLGDAASRAPLREIGAHRPVIPIVWAHHDDGHYVGRPYTPLPDFAAKLADAQAAGFGIIHWTTRPLDLYFSGLARQVWASTRDQPLRETCLDVAAAWYGAENRAAMGEYLESWITGAPQFGRDTTNWFIDRTLTDIPAVIAGCRARLAHLAKVRASGLTLEQRQQLDYQRGLEEFTAAFHEAHGYFQDSQDLLSQGDVTGARAAIAKCRPESVIEQFAHFSSNGGITRGEQGLVVSLNTRWLSHIVRHRQALGLEPVRINFAPTSHDKLAQARGTFSFHFGPQHELWECRGEEETRAPVFSLPDSFVIANAASVSPATQEVCRTGIEFSQPLSFSLRPILAASNRAKAKSLPLLPGNYRLRVLVIDPASTAPGQRVFEIKVADAPVDRVDVFSRAGGAHRVVEIDYHVAVNASGTVDLTVTPVTGKAILCGVVLEMAPTASIPLP